MVEKGQVVEKTTSRASDQLNSWLRQNETNFSLADLRMTSENVFDDSILLLEENKEINSQVDLQTINGDLELEFFIEDAVVEEIKEEGNQNEENAEKILETFLNQQNEDLEQEERTNQIDLQENTFQVQKQGPNLLQMEENSEAKKEDRKEEKIEEERVEEEVNVEEVGVQVRTGFNNAGDTSFWSDESSGGEEEGEEEEETALKGESTGNSFSPNQEFSDDNPISFFTQETQTLISNGFPFIFSTCLLFIHSQIQFERKESGV